MPNPSGSFLECTEQLREIRAEMNHGFDYMRGKLDEANDQLRQGSVQIALSAQRIEAISEEQAKQANVIRRIQDPTPAKGLPAQPPINWAAQAAMVAVISALASSFTGYAIYSWAKHVTEAAKAP